ncbi:hypothetical protein [Silicimonas sp. MF1-12-2]|uniref:hypothetical protein n=1 Tax=Silicimonas sp. MF1-12-2 TaxID=3384793 RepID=UPI0039B5211B
MARVTDSIDPKGLIYESYRIEGIGDAECRSIFLDWAISVPVGEDSCAMVRHLLLRYGGDNPDHPMTSVLQDALGPQTGGVRRGGARGRRTGNA